MNQESETFTQKDSKYKMLGLHLMLTCCAPISERMSGAANHTRRRNAVSTTGSPTFLGASTICTGRP